MKTIRPNPLTISYRVATSEDMILKAKNLCHDVYLGVGYIDAPYADRIIPFEYDETASYIVAVNEAQEVVGTVRVTQGPPFKTFEVWKEKLHPEYAGLINDALRGNAFEIGALAVRKDYCTMKISWGLYTAAYYCAKALELDYGIISMDHRALRSLEMRGWVVIKIGEPINYFGSLTVPGIMPVSQQQPASATFADNSIQSLMDQIRAYTRMKKIKPLAA